MEKKELLLKTIFACIACDGEIAAEEVCLLREIVSKTDLFDGVEIDDTLKRYVESINRDGALFLKQYLNEVAECKLSKDEQMCLVDLALKTIEADNRIDYSEVKFFKKIRTRLTLSDEEILAQHPDKEDYLLPDITVAADPEWSNVIFTEINFGV